MTREIKFRAWCEDLKQKSDSGTLDDFLHTNEDWHGMRIYFHPHQFIPKSSCVLMQYTGLKDKHGVEIYEGDAVKVGTKICNVVFDNGAFRLVGSNGYSQYLNCGFIERKRIEVIGNIYEHPEPRTACYNQNQISQITLEKLEKQAMKEYAKKQ